MILKRFNVTRSADDPLAIERLKAEGYVPVKDYAEAPPEPKPEEPVKDLRKMTKAELVEMAGEAGVQSAKSLTKAELVEVLS